MKGVGWPAQEVRRREESILCGSACRGLVELRRTAATVPKAGGERLIPLTTRPPEVLRRKAFASPFFIPHLPRIAVAKASFLAVSCSSTTSPLSTTSLFSAT